MELKFLLIRRSSARILFLVQPDEEIRVRNVVESIPRKAAIVAEGSFSSANLQEVRRALLDLKKLEALLRSAGTLAVSTKAAHSTRITEKVCQAHLDGVRVIDLETALLELDPSVPSRGDELVRMLAQKGVRQNSGLRAYARLKICLEPLLAVALIVILSPILVAIAIVVKLTSPGGIFYSQTRVGYRGAIFKIYKFRSMRTDAESNGPVWASADRNDQRLTRVGAFLRESHLDELPQLWNVVLGELSFIGPRPERPIFVKDLTQEIPLFRLRTLVKPGITGWAQTQLGYANSVADSRRKLEFDFFYLLKRSPRLDLKIIFATIVTLSSGGTESKKRGLLLNVTEKMTVANLESAVTK